MKNKIKILTCTCILCMGILLHCSEIPDGYIPETIGIAQNYVILKRGVDTRTQKPDLNGASYPVYFSLGEVTDENGNPTTDLIDSVTTRIWKEPYSHETDKTIEDIYAKLDTIIAPAMQVSEASGQLRFTSATNQLPGGTHKISLIMSNSAGTRTYKDVLTVVIPTDEDSETHRTVEPGGYSWNSSEGGWNNTVETSATYEVVHNPKGPNEITLMYCDKNGKPFNWAAGEIIQRGDRQSLEKISFEAPIYKEDRAVFRYPFAPFPFAPGGENGYTNYYRIPAQYITYADPNYSGFMNLLIEFQVFVDGEWLIKITNPVAIHK